MKESLKRDLAEVTSTPPLSMSRHNTSLQLIYLPSHVFALTELCILAADRTGGLGLMSLGLGPFSAAMFGCWLCSMGCEGAWSACSLTAWESEFCAMPANVRWSHVRVLATFCKFLMSTPFISPVPWTKSDQQGSARAQTMLILSQLQSKSVILVL